MRRHFRNHRKSRRRFLIPSKFRMDISEAEFPRFPDQVSASGTPGSGVDGIHTFKRSASGFCTMQRIPLAVILLALLLSLSAGCTKGEPQTGSLEVTSAPADREVQVILDGNFQGVTPLLLTNLPAGSHLLQLRSTGYAEKVELVTVSAGQKMIFSATYPPLPTLPQGTPTAFPATPGPTP